MKTLALFSALCLCTAATFADRFPGVATDRVQAPGVAEVAPMASGEISPLHQYLGTVQFPCPDFTAAGTGADILDRDNTGVGQEAIRVREHGMSLAKPHLQGKSAAPAQAGAGWLDAESASCTSCHDGTTAIDAGSHQYTDQHTHRDLHTHCHQYPGSEHQHGLSCALSECCCHIQRR